METELKSADWRFLLEDTMPTGVVVTSKDEGVRLALESLDIEAISNPETSGQSIVCFYRSDELSLGVDQHKRHAQDFLEAISIFEVNFPFRSWKPVKYLLGSHNAVSYWQLPSRQNSRFSILATRRHFSSGFLHGHPPLSRWTFLRVVSRLNLQTFVGPYLTIVVSNRRRPLPYVYTIMRHADPTVVGIALVASSFAGKNWVTYLGMDKMGNVRLVSKVPRSREHVEELKHELDMMDAVNSHRIKEFRTPEVLNSSDLLRVGILQTGLEGVPITRRQVASKPIEFGSLAAKIVRALPITRGERESTSQRMKLVLEKLKESHCSKVAHLSQTTLASGLLAEVRDLPSVFEHGDLMGDNILVSRIDTPGLIDWERARIEGMPLHDLVTFTEFVSTAALRKRDSLERATEYYRVLNDVNGWMRPLMREELSRLNISFSRLLPLVIFSWVIHTEHALNVTERETSASEDEAVTCEHSEVAPYLMLWKVGLEEYLRNP